MGTSAERQAWLEQGRAFCSQLLSAVDCIVPDNVRVTIGWPSTGGRSKRIGECWDATASTDGQYEVFVSPRLTDSVEIMGVLIHELIHAAVGTKAKHGKLFKRPAVAVGLQGKMTATVVGDALKATFTQWLETAGPYPAGGLNLNERKKQTTRMLKCDCALCGYTIRTAAKWLAEYGPPLCPNPAHSGEPMQAQEPSEEEDDPSPPPPKAPRKPKSEPKEPPAPKPAPPLPEPPKAKPLPPKAEAKATGVTFRVSTPEDDTWGTFGTDLKSAKVAARKQSKEGARLATVIATDKAGLEIGRYEFSGGLFTHATGDYFSS